MTSRFILNKFDLDLASARLLVRLGFVLVVVVFTGTVNGIMVVDERVFHYSGWAGRWRRVAICGCWVSRMHVEGSLALAHSWGSGLPCVLQGVNRWVVGSGKGRKRGRGVGIRMTVR